LKYLITGGCGFLGSNIAHEILDRNSDELVVFDNLSRTGSQKNLEWLMTFRHFTFIHGDVRNRSDVEAAIRGTRPDRVFHLAGQVAMTTSIKDPRLDFEINALGTLNILESIRIHCPEAIVIYSSTNKVYGDLEWEHYDENDLRYIASNHPYGFDESTPLDFHSPYGCSKGCADQYMRDYYRIFGIRTVVFRHSSMYGGRQFATIDQGWIGWFCEMAVRQSENRSAKPFTISGNGKQVRDLLHAEDMVNLYLSAAESIEKIKGQAFNIGGGIENSLSLLELFLFLEQKMQLTLTYNRLPPRESDQKLFIANIASINTAIGWMPKIDKETGISRMIEWIKSVDQDTKYY
jgi:CDP-paratose 2-epimerase